MSKQMLQIKPYARLITMLGDQLIKNELIALTELIKNSYDADASFVKISFIDFGEDFSLKDESKIIIEDDGCGMDADILVKHWLNPATPEKLKRKRREGTTPKGRFLQGEKGIGRFAIFKLGSSISITTRRRKQNQNGDFLDEGEEEENTLVYDFSKYSDDFLEEDGVEKDLFLSDLEVELSTTHPNLIVPSQIELGASQRIRPPYGTVIEITNLKTSWTKARVARIQEDVGKLQPLFSKNLSDGFGVWIYKDNKAYKDGSAYKEKLQDCLNNKSVFRITEGHFDAQTKTYSFLNNGIRQRLSFTDSDIQGLRDFKTHFKSPDYTVDCGSYDFEFYLFDLNAGSANPSKYYLNKSEKEIVKAHRIYLYRDGIRVMPYGDVEDDWLRIDISRGILRASEYLSNDQVVGCVYITQEENPKLRDKTNREGLIDEGSALGDFTASLRLILKYLREKPYAKYLIDEKKKKEIDTFNQGRPAQIIGDAKEKFRDNKEVSLFLSKFETSYNAEKKTLENRLDITENLAAVGLSVETASHDIMLFLKRVVDQLDRLLLDLQAEGDLDKEVVSERLSSILGHAALVESLMRDVQLLFPSTKSRKKKIRVTDIVEKVYGLYKNALTEHGIDVEILSSKTPLNATTTDAVLLQVFINLFDNALYWLQTCDEMRRIVIDVNGDDQKVVFSDSGPGVHEEDVAYIFEPFYSGKGVDGRGLGLYIARQLLDRYDFSIDLAEDEEDCTLKGANFVVDFSDKEQR